ncbi:hypothetical protein WAJ75_22235, partial [Acinetobacter baumannii]
MSPNGRRARTDSPHSATSVGHIALLAVQLDDQLFVNVTVNILSSRQRGNSNRHIFTLRHDPTRAA